MFRRLKAALSAAWKFAQKWDLLPGKSLALRRAEAIAAVLITSPSVERVYLFGGLARWGAGKDIDMVVVANHDMVYEFVSSLRELLKTWGVGYSGLAFHRTHTGLEMLGLAYDPDFNRVLGFGQTDGMSTRDWIDTMFYLSPRLDLFILPQDWQTNRSLRELPMEDPNFFDNISRDARLFLRYRGQFAKMSIWHNHFGKHVLLRKHPLYLKCKIWVTVRLPLWQRHVRECHTRAVQCFRLMRGQHN